MQENIDRKPPPAAGLDIAAQRARLKDVYGTQTVEEPLPRRQKSSLSSAILQLVEIEGYEAVVNSLAQDEIFAKADAASLPALLAAHGLACQQSLKRMTAITAKDLPCVAELKDGRILHLLSMNGKDIRAAENNSLVVLPAKRLKAMGLARIHRVSPAANLSDTTNKWPGFYRAAWDFLKTSEQPLLAQMMVASAIGYVLMLALPLFTMAVYDRVIPHMAMETLWALGIGVILALVLDFALRNVRLRLSDAVSLSATNFLQGLLFHKILRTRSQHAPQQPAPVQQGLREIECLAQLMPQAIVSLAIDAPFFLALVMFLAVLGGPIALAPLVGLCGVCLLQLLHFRNAAKSNGALFQTGQKQAGLVGELVEGLDRIKALGAVAHVSKLWDRLTGSHLMQLHENRVTGGLTAQGGVIVTQLVTVMVLIIGVYEVRAGQMSMGALIACILLVGRTVAPMAACVTLIMRLMHMKKTISWLDEIMTAKDESVAGEAKANPCPDYAFENVSFAYEGSERPSLANLTFRINHGERIAIIGRSGSGKSTLLKLLARIEEPSGGLLRLDGFNIVQYEASRVRAMAGYAAQSPVLFEGSLWQNLTFGMQSPDRADVEQICRMTGVARFAADHPEGFGMQVGARGERLSGGERQAVALARTLLSSPDMLLLDEPTAAFDTQGEEEFILGLAAWLGQRSLVIATHRLPVLKLVDRIILLDKGQVVADGSRQDVLEKLSRKTA